MEHQPYKIAVAASYAPLGRFINLTLTIAGYQAYLFADGEQILDHLSRQPFDAAILDADLPRGSAFVVCHRIRGSTDVPVVLLLMRGEPSQQMYGRQVGASAFIFIPFGVDELLGCMAAVLPNAEHPATEHA
jgi:two-component system KDP operon response regulator KdpE